MAALELLGVPLVVLDENTRVLAQSNPFAEAVKRLDGLSLVLIRQFYRGGR